VPNDGRRTQRAPVPANGETVLIAIHVRVSADRNAHMLADHARRDREDRVRVTAFRRLFRERIEKPQPCFVLAQAQGRVMRLGDLDDDRDDADTLPVLVEHRRIVEIEPDALAHLPAIENQLEIAIRDHLAAPEHDFHDVVVEVRDLGPAVAHRRAEQSRMPRGSELRIGVVVDHRALVAPPRDDRDRRAQDQANGGLERSRPSLNGPERCFRPVKFRDDAGDFAAACEKCLRRNALRHGRPDPSKRINVRPGQKFHRPGPAAEVCLSPAFQRVSVLSPYGPFGRCNLGT